MTRRYGAYEACHGLMSGTPQSSGRAALPEAVAPAGGNDVSIGRGGGCVEREHAPVEILLEYGSGRGFQCQTAAAFRQ
jgi:hypothetical protein